MGSVPDHEGAGVVGNAGEFPELSEEFNRALGTPVAIAKQVGSEPF